MSTTTEGLPPDADGGPTLPEGLLERALAGPGDPRKNPALLELIQLMLPYAMDQIHAALDDANPRRKVAPTTGQMRELRNAQNVPLPDDHPGEEDPEVRAEIARRTQDAIDRATEAALASAAESFTGHWLKEFADVRSLNDLALHLIRIAYNRHQNRRRRETRLGRQARSGNGMQAEGTFLATRPDGREDPASEAELRDFLRIQQDLTDGVLEGFSPRDRQIILLHVAGYQPNEIVSLINRLGRLRKPCTLRTTEHVIEMFAAQLGRMEEEADDPDERDPSNSRGDSDDDSDDERQ